jgi:hypothetical protein
LSQEQEQLAAIKRQMDAASSSSSDKQQHDFDKDFEGGYGGQEDLEDRYATTSGEH